MQIIFFFRYFEISKDIQNTHVQKHSSKQCFNYLSPFRNLSFELDFSYKFSVLQHFSPTFVAGLKRATDKGSLLEVAQNSPYYLPLNVLLLQGSNLCILFISEYQFNFMHAALNKIMICHRGGKRTRPDPGLEPRVFRLPCEHSTTELPSHLVDLHFPPA